MTSTQDQIITRIGGNRTLIRDELREMRTFREVLYFLVWRDIKVRYRQAKLGAFWVILQPLILVAVYTVVFSSFVKIPSARYPYSVFVLVGLLPWTLFSNAVQDAGSSLYLNSSLIGKVYFPRVFIPISRMIAIMLDYAVTAVLLFILVLIVRVRLTAWLLLLPILTIITFLFTVGVGIGLAALTARYWDVRYVTPFIFQIWLFCTPVIYPLTSLPERYRWIIRLNPLTGLVEAFRTAFLGDAPDFVQLAYCAVWSLAAIAIGTAYFNRTDAELVEVM